MESSFVGFLVFAIIGLSVTLQMQSGTAISCELGETTFTRTAVMDNCNVCREELQTHCESQGREVSHLECNTWNSVDFGPKLCEGCCRVPPTCPVKPPVEWTKCPDTDTDKTFKIENYTGKDCHRCEDGCKTRCDEIGSRVGDQICGYLNNGVDTVATGLYCTCCCRKNVPCRPPQPPTPPPPPPSPPPSCPSPPTCPCNTEVNVNVKHDGECQSCCAQ